MYNREPLILKLLEVVLQPKANEVSLEVIFFDQILILLALAESQILEATQVLSVLFCCEQQVDFSLLLS